MTTDIKELEKQLAAAKKQELYSKWETYLTKVKVKLDQLVGKSIINWYRNGAFTICKVTGVKEKYYIDEVGYNGQFSPKRWLEIEKTGFFDCRVADDRGVFYQPGISTGSYNYEFTKVKNSKLIISKLDFQETSCLADIQNSFKVGYTEYEKYSEDPSYDRALESITLFARIAPDGMYEDAKTIYLEHVQKTKDFWVKFEDSIKNAPRIEI